MANDAGLTEPWNCIFECLNEQNEEVLFIETFPTEIDARVFRMYHMPRARRPSGRLQYIKRRGRRYVIKRVLLICNEFMSHMDMQRYIEAK